ncbi:MAG: UDP-N-acetylmuramate dehydrogenase [Cyclobacteriaceae bacterium]|nr:UDP-N-acetylmuramate dehydrogenase [Cyclobacteriaceae bacterium]
MIELKEHTPLLHLNTFGVDVRARYFAEVADTASLEELRMLPVMRDQPRLILGGGSNILFTRDFQGLVIHNTMKGMRIVAEESDYVHVEAASGENWHGLVLYCLDRNWGGLENLSLIPGTTGAAPIQNIGAYGVEIKQVIECVDGIDLSSGQHRRLTPDECQFGYRESVFKHALREKFFISSITLRLTKKNHRLDTQYGAIREVLEQRRITSPTPRDVSDAVIAIRRSKLPDPAVVGNAGSFFKNPTVTAKVAESIRGEYPSMPSYPTENQYVKIPAGWLIEQCGWRGKKVGRVGVHPQQALVIVNYGGGTGAEIVALSEEIRASVRKKFQVELMTEVNIV